MSNERVVPTVAARPSSDRYKSFLQSIDDDEPITQPQNMDRVFKRMLTQRSVSNVMSTWTNRFVAPQMEASFQTWSVAYYSTTARSVMGAVTLFHALITAVDFSFSYDRHLTSTAAYFAAYGRTEIAQWAYLAVIAPFVVLTPAHVVSPLWATYMRQWKWVVAVGMVLLCTGLMVRTGCIYQVTLLEYESTYSAGTGSILAITATLPAVQQMNITTALGNIDLTMLATLGGYGSLVVAGDTILIFVTQMVVSTTHCDLVHTGVAWCALIVALIGNIAYWNVVPHSEAYVFFFVSGVLCFIITRELDLCHRTNFLHYYNAEKSAEVLREKLDEALELIIFDGCKDEEKHAVATTIEKNAELCVKLEPYRIPLENLKLQRVIGKGAFGEVILAEFCGTAVVMKRMHRHRINAAAVKEFTDEILLMCQLRHPNVVQFIGASWNTYSNIGFVLEYVGQGDLYVVIHDKRIPKSWTDPFHRIAVDSARGICYLHSKTIIHRDLKSSNILISPTYTAKICDLGMSKSMEELKANEKQVGTPLWTAPEVVTGGHFSLKSDVYAFGIILTELVTRKVPYAEMTKTKSAYKIMLEVAASGLRPALPAWLPQELRHLILTCLDESPDKRPSMLQVLDALQTNAMYQLHGRELWSKASGLVHEKAHMTTRFSLQMVKMVQMQSDLEKHTKPQAMDSDSDDDVHDIAAGDGIDSGHGLVGNAFMSSEMKVIETAIVEEW
ncbi:Aste57867_9351 [Aphanomyces stellatus]|uniref:Aste57867_9351 protein n=1 Tax=Aphanomyces stellatus TaxID=120398 RepID=A0A485KMT4_9STRA|nr:hypothetical protein As57867_009315 [Aphanomyces stellatus]VFT86232.1 Aste57867_9351 [Aphanomyces stellatus]